MKSTHPTFVIWVFSCLAAGVQVARPATPPGVSVMDRGPHHSTWQRVVQASKPDGTMFLRTNSYVQLENGAHYQNANGEWIESEETIDIVNGIGLAEKGLHKATFPANIRTAGGIDLLTPDGKRLRSHVMGLAYTDGRTGQSVLIAEPKDAIGEVAGNEVTYPDAFTDFTADVRYTFTKTGLEQDIIFLENPPGPAEYGLDPNTTRLEVFTEFLEAPVPEKRSSVLIEETNPVRRQGMLEPDLTDEFLSFGIMSIGQGRAFPANAAAGDENGVLVGKSWSVIGGRTFLIEKVDYRSVVAELQRLPQAAALQPRPNPMKRGDLLAQLRATAGANTRSLQLASAAHTPKGFVVDYQIVSSAPNVTLQADVTYLVTNNFTLSGTTRLEACVVKYTTNTGTSPKLIFTGPIDCQTAPGRPAFFVSKDDDTVGDLISGSTGTPAGTYAFRALELSNSGYTYDLHNLRVRHASRALFTATGTKLSLKHAQIGNGFRAVDNFTLPLYVRNVLLHNLTYAIGSTHTAHVEHATIHCVSNLWIGSAEDRLRLTNSLVIAVTNLSSFLGNYVVTNQSDTGFFQTVGAAARYLATGSTNRQAGTTNITPSLLADLRKRTTFAPVVLTNDITTDTTLSLQAPRGYGLPDLGYAYDPLDFVAHEVDVSAALTIEPGTAVGVYGANGSYGLQIIEGGSVDCQGTATDLCRFLRYNLVQEQATSAWSATSCGYTLITPESVGSPYPFARFRFTEFTMPPAGTEHFYVGFGDGPFVIFIDSQFGSGRFLVDTASSTFTNCLFERVDSTFAGTVGGFQNNLFYGGTATFAPATGNPFYISDNLFDKTTVSQIGSLTHDYNGYVTNASGQWLTNGGAHNVFTNSFAYESGTLGRYYQPSSSPFLNIGSTNANVVGLYHHTVLTANNKETNSVVDIGFHWVATDANAIPIDTDQDGTPDYLEDANGNGVFDVGEGDWNSYTSPNGLTGTPGLQVFTPLK